MDSTTFRSDSIERTQEDMRQAIQADQGIVCPCCKQKVKVYTRRVDYSIAMSLSYLVFLFRQHGRPVHYMDLAHPFGRTVTVTHWNIVRYWNLAEKITRDHPWWPQVEKILVGDPDKPNSGYWIPTDKGIDFVNMRVKVPAWDRTYNSDSVRKSGEMVDINQCFGEKFSYAKLMGYLL